MSDSFQGALELREILVGTRAQSVKQVSWTVLGYNSELLPVRFLEVDGAVRKESCLQYTLYKEARSAETSNVRL